MLSGYAASVRDQIDRRAMTLLSTGHAAVDFSGGALPALLPFLKTEFDLSYTLVARARARLGALVVDRPAAVRALVGPPRRDLAAPGGRRGRRRSGWRSLPSRPTYWLVVVLRDRLRARHGRVPSRRARSSPPTSSGRKRASGMSLFSVGGNLGYGLGALVVDGRSSSLGLRGGWLLVVPVRSSSRSLLLAAARLPARLRPGPARRRRVERRARTTCARSAILLAVITFRSLAWFGLITFVPLYEVSQGHSKSYGNDVFAGMLLVGADRHAARRADSPTGSGCAPCCSGSFVDQPPLMLVFLLVGGDPGRDRARRRRRRPWSGRSGSRW